jgi:anti-sigma regulatory factor (Ser/Thr protein kinase)
MCRLQQAEYPRNPRAVREARHWLRDILARWDVIDVIDSAGLLLTELITNAVVHAQSQVRVVASIADGMLEVGVADEASHTHLGPASLAQPSEIPLAGLVERGRGLALVAHLADAWGVAALDRGKQVWFRLPVSQSWAHRAQCPCADESSRRIRLDSGRFAVAVAGPWDPSAHDQAVPPSR